MEVKPTISPNINQYKYNLRCLYTLLKAATKTATCTLPFFSLLAQHFYMNRSTDGVDS